MKQVIGALLLFLAGCGSQMSYNAGPIVDSYSKNFVSSPTSSSKMLIGDSITAGLGPNVKGEWVNRGIPGNSSEYLNQEFDEHIQLEHPREVIIAIGINDIHYGTPLEKFKENYAAFVDRLLGMGAEVKIRSILPSNYMPEFVPRYNAALMKIAEDRGLTYINTYPYFDIGNGGLILEYTYDGTHLTGEGYQIYLEHFEEDTCPHTIKPAEVLGN